LHENGHSLLSSKNFFAPLAAETKELLVKHQEPWWLSRTAELIRLRR